MPSLFILDNRNNSNKCMYEYVVNNSGWYSTWIELILLLLRPVHGVKTSLLSSNPTPISIP